MAFAPLFDPTQQFMARSGAPLAGGLLYVYRNTSQELATLKNVAGTTIANPVTLDADGRASGGVFVSDASTYTLVVKDAFEATQWTIASMSPLGGGSGGGGGGEDTLWGHWENKDTWKNIGQYTTSVEMAQYMTRSEGELGKDGRPYLLPGLYDYKLELAFNMWGETDAKEFRTYNLNIKYGNDTLREMAFNFRADTTENYMLTEWACGVFKMQNEGYIDINVWKVMGGNENHRLKVSHLFIHTIA